MCRALKRDAKRRGSWHKRNGSAFHEASIRRSQLVSDRRLGYEHAITETDLE
jgi:hypothetical protein